MKIVIAGAGEVGSHLAKLLSNEEQDIMLVDDNADRLAVLDANYNLMTLVGNPTSFASLREAGAGSCDLFIAVTPYESNNIVACSIAKNLGAATTVARIRHLRIYGPGQRRPRKAHGCRPRNLPRVSRCPGNHLGPQAHISSATGSSCTTAASYWPESNSGRGHPS